ncbi:hypothetical protein BDB00DRAFT_413802 [Zychaea mexicana]|uniref:uncharacterized protein n=1 Tax=Zychaea mexicana TaxID=64656 RepID=UPI0022FDDB6A|nr:uncharacterized protein BDB00DRAFT_413802 [Zychaea mexicana]KAI9492922.1 hypothetical protein BDB00DRAFT_413802 [Zychaea mexicana]
MRRDNATRMMCGLPLLLMRCQVWLLQALVRHRHIPHPYGSACQFSKGHVFIHLPRVRPASKRGSGRSKPQSKMVCRQI